MLKPQESHRGLHLAHLWDLIKTPSRSLPEMTHTQTHTYTHILSSYVQTPANSWLLIHWQHKHYKINVHITTQTLAKKKKPLSHTLLDTFQSIRHYPGTEKLNNTQTHISHNLSPLCSGSFKKLHLCWRLVVWKSKAQSLVPYGNQPECFSHSVELFSLMPRPSGRSICSSCWDQSPLTQVWRHHGWPAPRSAFSKLIHTDRPNADH